MRLFGQLTKIEDQPDGTLKVFGVASTGARDDEGEVVSPAAMKAALPDYARYPALREMHQPTAAGRTLEATVDDEGATRIVAHVVDPVAIAKVKSRTYSGFSIGGRVLARDAADPTVITRIKLSEISLVDRPANPEAVIDLWKAATPAPSNAAVKAQAAELASAAGRPGAWKDYVAKARAALIAKAALADAGEDEAPDDAAPDNAAPDQSAPGDKAPAAPTPANDNDPVGEAASAGDDDEPDADADMPDDPSDLAQRLASLAASDPGAAQSLHDLLASLGAACDPDNCPDAGKHAVPFDLAKALPRLDALERRLAEQHALIERLAAAPLPPRTAASSHARAIGKAADADPGAPDAELTPGEIQKAFDALTPDERAFLLMKASLRTPIPLG